MRTTTTSFFWILFLNLLFCGVFAQANPNLFRRQVSPEFKPSSKINVLMLDADSTLRVTKSGAPYAINPTDYLILPGVAEKLRAYNKAGYLVVVMSNQTGIAKGNVAREVVDAAFKNMVDELKEKHHARIDYFDYAENIAENDAKPKIGMHERLAAVLKSKFGDHFEIDTAKSIMVGDAAYSKNEFRADGRPGHDFSNFDREFAQNMKVKFIEPNHFFGWQKYGVERIHNASDAQQLEALAAPGSCRGRVFFKTF